MVEPKIETHYYNCFYFIIKKINYLTTKKVKDIKYNRNTVNFINNFHIKQNATINSAIII
ncbi:hypothetical protein EM308_15560 [Flavobacterium gilvum]|uniref:Uncharacterized protein n=1 Tax=Flavobacterium gilvum TaxID=1492737 RepID=A0AAC9I7M4_9FLAO|nr:hypothetical protein EM308_15560 [Flavobacterium gilvum]KFC59944.1 hypothetical protein FEM08_12480 [Flavobacterium gilvum]